MSDRFHVTYRLTLHDDESPDDRIRALQLEQSAELPDAVVQAMDMDHVTGDVIRTDFLDPLQLDVTIAWPASNHGEEITQLLNILFGNISMKQGIAIVDIQWDDLAPHLLGGPSLGIEALRARWQIPDRALSCTALKPMGQNTSELAESAFRFALGGIDIIKDDHGLADQSHAPFADRVAACVRAMDKAAQKTGRRSRYFPNITTDHYRIGERYEQAAEAGADGVLLAPMLTGLSVMHQLAQNSTDLPVMAHPAFSGKIITHATSPGYAPCFARKSGTEPTASRTDPERCHGFGPGLFYGALWRALGADFVIYPNTGGRFSFPYETCSAINQQARRTDLPFKTCFPVPGGGMKHSRMGYWLEQYGDDTTFLMGGSLYEDSRGIAEASRSFLQSLMHK